MNSVHGSQNAVASVTPQMLENTWHGTEYCSDILWATSGTHREQFEQFIQTQ